MLLTEGKKTQSKHVKEQINVRTNAATKREVKANQQKKETGKHNRVNEG
jgi:hypothetical protein